MTATPVIINTYVVMGMITTKTMTTITALPPATRGGIAILYMKTVTIPRTEIVTLLTRVTMIEMSNMVKITT